MSYNQQQSEYGSKDIVKAAIRMALSANRDEEKELKTYYSSMGIKSCAVDYGGEFISSIMKITVSYTHLM